MLYAAGGCGGGDPAAGYNEWGLPLSSEDLDGNRTEYAYDGFGRTEVITDALGQATHLAYNDDGHETVTGLTVTITHPDGQSTLQRYNGLGQLKRLVEPGGVKTDYEYDALGRQIKVSLPYTTAEAEAWNETGYDALGRPLTITRAGAGATTYEYDGATVRVRDVNHHVVEYDQTAFGQVAAVREYTGTFPSQVAYATTRYGYNGLGQLGVITDTLGNTTQFFYDGLGRKIGQVDMDMGEWVYTYDGYGDLATQTDARGVVTTFSYDALGRLRGKAYDTSADARVAATGPITYTYSTRQLLLEDGSGSTLWQVDGLGRVLTETRLIDGRAFTTRFGYDDVARQQTMTYPDGEGVTTIYNERGLPDAVTGYSSYLASAAYNGPGLPVAWGLGGVLTQTLGSFQDPLHPQALSTANGSGSLRQLTFGFDALGRLETYQGHGLNATYAYDPLNRLVQVNDATYSQDYAYDPIGNLTRRYTTTLTYPDQGQPRPHAPTAAGDGTTFGYDLNGNLITKTLVSGHVISYTYDAENRLTQVISETGTGTVTTAFVYDGDGQQVKRVAPDGEETFYAGEHYQITQDYGEGSWGEKSPVFDSTGPMQGQANMLGDANGNLYLVWVEEPSGQPISEIYFAKRSATSGLWSEPELVRSIYQNDYTLARPVVAADANGNVTVAWQEQNLASSNSYITTNRRRVTINQWDTLPKKAADSNTILLAIAAAADNSFFLAWSDGDAHVARRRLNEDDWTGTYSVSSAPSVDLTADSLGNVYLAYRSNIDNTLYVVPGVIDNGWGTPEPVIGSSSDFPLLAIDSQNRLVVVWNGDNPLAKRRIAENSWGDVEDTRDHCGSGGNWGFKDMAIDGADFPWVIYPGFTPETFREICVQSGYLDTPQETDFFSTIATGPNGTVVAVWTAGTMIGTLDDLRLHQAIYDPDQSTTVTKHYFAGSQQLALSINDELYYTLPDPTGASLFLTNADGSETGHILYDAFGGVLTSTLPVKLTAALSGQGALADPDTGLVHLGNGRYYDPSMGRPLQPNPAGGRPVVPQTINRYAATSMGQPGVAEGANAWDPFNDPVTSNIGRSATAVALAEGWNGAGRGLTAYHNASFQQVAIRATRTRRVPISQAIDDAILDIGTAGALLRDVIGAPPGSSRSGFFGLGYEWFLLAGRWNSRFVTERYISGYVMRHQYPGARLAGRLGLWLKNPLARDLVIGAGLNAGYQAWLDYDNPYLTSGAYHTRWLIAGGTGLISVGAAAVTTTSLGGAVAGAFLGGPPVWIGIGVGTIVAIVLDVAIVPRVYNFLGANPTRDLAPLQH